MPETLYPEPVVTGSLYASGGLDEVFRGLLPLQEFLRKARGEGEPAAPYLWCLRYSRGGEHLKVRIHGPRSIEEAVRMRLEEVAEEALRSLALRPAEEPRQIRPDAIPIDLEDRAEEGPPDRSFRFTHYEASPVSLGGEPFLGDEGYRARMTLALGRGCDRVLSLLAESEGALAPAQRLRLLLRALLDGMAALPLALDEVASYLAYHRDWLIRFPLLRKGGDEAKASALLAELDQRVEQAGTAVEALRGAVARSWGKAAGSGAAASPWGQALAALHHHVALLSGRLAAPPDPFAEQPFYSPLFKALHGLGNQAGIKQLDEAYAYHLLLRAAVPDRARHQRIALTPD